MQSGINQIDESQSCGRILVPLLPIHIEFLIHLLELDLVLIDDFIRWKREQFEKFNARHKSILHSRLNPDDLNTAFAEQMQEREAVRDAYVAILKILKSGKEEARYVA